MRGTAGEEHAHQLQQLRSAVLQRVPSMHAKKPGTLLVIFSHGQVLMSNAGGAKGGNTGGGSNGGAVLQHPVQAPSFTQANSLRTDEARWQLRSASAKQGNIDPLASAQLWLHGSDSMK